MASLLEQMKAVQLKESKDKTRDYSDPKLAGYTSQEEILDYQNKVLDVNTEQWMDLLQSETFPSSYCSLTFEEAELFITLYERLYKDKDPLEIRNIQWRDHLSPDEIGHVDSLTERLQEAMQRQLDIVRGVFVKTSSRSAKDAPLYKDKFVDLFREELNSLEVDSDRMDENQQITCLLKAAFRSMRMRHACDVIDMFLCSERIYQDMLLAVGQKQRFHENFVIRQFVDIDVDMEFRGFVWNLSMTALSQYNYLIFSPRLVKMKEQIKATLCSFYTDVVRPKLEATAFPDCFIIDFAICDRGSKVWVIEINPFLTTTDSALFSWQHERHILEGAGDIHFRITERPKPGSVAMLPRSAREIFKTCLQK